MEHFPKPLNREESTKFLQVVLKRQAEDCFCFWPVEAPGVSSFLGFGGLARPHFEAHFTPGVEIGWRLAHDHWDQGYATEAAVGALNYGFDTLGLDEIVSFTVPGNARSRAVMERIGMTRRPEDDFEHPGLPAGHPLRPHVLYRLRRPD